MKESLIIIYLTLIIGASAVYCVALKQPRGTPLVVNHRTSYVQAMSYRTVTIVLVPVELLTSIYGSHAAMYIVNAYLFQICL